MRVLVCGGRIFHDWPLVRDTLDSVSRLRRVEVIIHGGATGVDYLARRWASELGRPVLEFRPNWELHGRAAGPIRNQRMLDEGKPDLVVAFPGGKGTADMVRRAKAAGLEVIEVKA
ncbi:MAG TPA: DUF2493 domain-containing protein [Kofleriaceae bacterium]|nr:DUF2493 domain-containing protein [Kofleriaceae bacterium]